MKDINSLEYIKWGCQYQAFPFESFVIRHRVKFCAASKRFGI